MEYIFFIILVVILMKLCIYIGKEYGTFESFILKITEKIKK